MENKATMIQDMSIELLSEKMKELENALFVTEANTLLKLPTHIVQIAEVDEEGNAWFIIPKPTQVIESFDTDMPAKLDFFKKGKGFYLKLRGLASIIQSEELMPRTRVFQELSGSFKKGELVAVRLKMQSAEYFENASKVNMNPVWNIGSAVYNWLLEPLFSDRKRDWVTIPVYAENS
jgi:general stress protein 26